MNKLVLSALAATVCVGTTNANESDWAGLDAELTALTTSMVKDGPTVSGYLEATYDSDAETWGIGRNRLTLSGGSGGYGYNVSFDAAGDDHDGDDAYVTFTMGGIGWTMGTFRAPTTGNHLEAEADLHFLDRNGLGGGGARTNGLMASGNMDALGWAAHYDDGGDITARITYDVMSGDGVNLSVAYASAEDDSWIEANVSSGAFGLSYTMGDNDAGNEDDASSLVASYDVNEMWNLAVRSENDGGAADDVTTIAATHSDGGARWTIQMDDDDEITVGVLVGF
jgi:hypothetical protein